MADNKPLPVNWNWQTPIDFFENWTPPDADGRSDVGSMSLSSSAVVGDLEIVTLMMYMPSGDTPYLVLGAYPDGDFVDQTDQWVALPGFAANDCYIQSWWRVATADSVADGYVAVNLYNFDAPLDPDGGSTEGGNVFLNVIRTDEEPSVAYQQGSTDDTFVTPDHDPDTVLHFFFARRDAPAFSNVHGVVIYDTFYTPGLEGIPAGGFAYVGHQWMTQVLEDNEFYNGTFWQSQDLYAVGFYYSNNTAGTAEFQYTGPITWNLTEARSSDEAFGAAGGVVQGIKVKTGGGALIMFI